MMISSITRPRTGLRSFRAKFLIVVGGAVFFDLLVSGSLALWNVQRLSRDATAQVGKGLEAASQDYIRAYADSTAAQVGLLLDQVHSDVKSLAGVLQGQIDHPSRNAAIGAAMEQAAPGAVTVTFDRVGQWAQNAPGSPSVISVWGYLLGADHRPAPEVQADIDTSAVLDLVAPQLLQNGASKLQMYYIGPKDRPIFRTAPYTDQAQTFDRLYPGHNMGRFWTFFFPGLYESWQGWADDPNSKPVSSNITQTMPYTDAITGRLIVSFFHPLWTAERRSVAGAVGADITLDQLATIVEHVKVADTGFGFLTMSDGNVVAINAAGEKTIGLRAASDASNKGVTGVDRSLRNSSQKAISALPLDANGVIQHISLKEKDEDVPFLVITRQLDAINLWVNGPVKREVMSLGIVVPEREIYASLVASRDQISRATKRILIYQVLAVFVSLLIVTAAVFAASKRITSGISALASAARRIQAKDYSVRVDIASNDEVAEAGLAFNRMAEQISFNTENLENLVVERTKEIESAKEEISTLNGQLKSENRRLGAELDVARQIQLMVLPRGDELTAIEQLDIAAYMRPADEVGGDYYDVLQNGDALKIGIGDVTGHGLESGVLMLMVQSVARALQEAGETSPLKFLANLNRAIYKNVERTRTDKHLTLSFLDYSEGQFTVSGQHEDLIVIRSTGEIERIDTGDLGFPVGLEPDISPFIGTLKVSFQKGDLIVLHTDGVTEAENPSGEMFGIDRLCDHAYRLRGQTADQMVNGILDSLMTYIGTQKIHDDITLVVVRHR